MASPNQRPSLMGGLIRTSLGILFLLKAFSIGPNFWSIAARYWPILLILLGLGKIIDYFRRRRGFPACGRGRGRYLFDPPWRLFTRLSNSRFPDMVGRIPWHIRGVDVGGIGDWQGTSFTFNQEASYPITTTMALRVENSYGGVIVSQAATGRSGFVFETWFTKTMKLRQSRSLVKYSWKEALRAWRRPERRKTNPLL